jgi:putative transcriptional regulator
MNKRLAEQACVCLLGEGFTVKGLTNSCFDVLARKGSHILLVKVLKNANSISKEHTEEMLRLSSFISATPLIIAEEAGCSLQDNVVYSRYGIFALNFKTFKNCIENKLPFIKQNKAGLTASVIGNKLKELREQEGLSLNDLSKKIGVSKRMVSNYEQGISEITMARAFRLYDLFGHKVFSKIDIFSADKETLFDCKSLLSKKYMELGFNAAETRKVPFDIIAKKDNNIILTEVGDSYSKQLTSLSRLLDAENLVIFKSKKPKDIPAVTKKEFMDFEESNELIKFVREY